jgi:hypothetical protein
MTTEGASKRVPELFQGWKRTHIGISNSPTLRTQPSSVARLIFKPMSLSRIMLCQMQGRVIAILADDRLDDDAVTRQALLDDRGGRGAETTSAISWPQTPPSPTGRPKKLAYAFSSKAAFSDSDPAC